MKDARKAALVLSIVLLAIISLCVAYIFVWMPMETNYDYDVKAEQVYDNGKINQSVSLDSLSESEQTILYDAFKKSDHFFGGGAGVTISTDERLDTFSGWKVVEFQGVYIVVAIEGPDVAESAATWLWFPAMVIGAFAAVFLSFTIGDVINPPY